MKNYLCVYRDTKHSILWHFCLPGRYRTKSDPSEGPCETLEGEDGDLLTISDFYSYICSIMVDFKPFSQLFSKEFPIFDLKNTFFHLWGQISPRQRKRFPNFCMLHATSLGSLWLFSNWKILGAWYNQIFKPFWSVLMTFNHDLWPWHLRQSCRLACTLQFNF